MGIRAKRLQSSRSCRRQFANDRLVRSHAYDALSRQTEVRSNGVLVASNSYDCQGRRVRLVTQTAAHTFIYDGWNVVLELVEHDGVTDRIEYYWGKDISGSLQGAGGVGGLLYLKRNGAIFVPFYDAYGNVMEYRAADGSLVASYVYDAFGRTISQTGPLADKFRFRYSTKSFDCETGLCYYGKRFYVPNLRRWLNRDPIKENGGMNLYAFCLNAPSGLYDILGLACRLGTFNVLSLVVDAKPAMNGLSRNPDLIKQGESLLQSLGMLDLLSAPASLMTGSALSRLISALDIAAGKIVSPDNNAMEQIRRLLEQLKKGPIEVYGKLEYEMCQCKDGKTQMVRQKPPITDEEQVLDPTDAGAVRGAYNSVLKEMMRQLTEKIKLTRGKR